MSIPMKPLFFKDDLIMVGSYEHQLHTIIILDTDESRCSRLNLMDICVKYIPSYRDPAMVAPVS